MDEREHYEQDINRKLSEARDRLDKATVAGGFLKKPEGRLVQDWINERVTYLMEKMTGKDPLSDREYLSYHGAIRELKDFNVMLNGKAGQQQSAQEEVNALNEQQRALTAQESIKF